jgi:hypothetical protein
MTTKPVDRPSQQACADAVVSTQALKPCAANVTRRASETETFTTQERAPDTVAI